MQTNNYAEYLALYHHLRLLYKKQKHMQYFLILIVLSKLKHPNILSRTRHIMIVVFPHSGSQTKIKLGIFPRADIA